MEQSKLINGYFEVSRIVYYDINKTIDMLYQHNKLINSYTNAELDKYYRNYVFSDYEINDPAFRIKVVNELSLYGCKYIRYKNRGLKDLFEENKYQIIKGLKSYKDEDLQNELNLIINGDNENYLSGMLIQTRLYAVRLCRKICEYPFLKINITDVAFSHIMYCVKLYVSKIRSLLSAYNDYRGGEYSDNAVYFGNSWATIFDIIYNFRENWQFTDDRLNIAINEARSKSNLKLYTRKELLSQSASTETNITGSKLSKYLTGDEDSFNHILTHKVPKDGKKCNWIGKLTDAVIFADYLNISTTKFNECFTLLKGGELKDSNRGRKEAKDSPLYAILYPKNQ